MLQTIIKLSIVGGLLTVILQCLRPLTRKVFSAKWQYYIWLIVLIAMVVPINIKLSPYSAKLLLTPPTQISQVNALKTAEKAKQPHSGSVIYDIPEEKIKFEAVPINSEEISKIAAAFWSFGVALFLTFHAVVYLIFLYRVKNNSYSVDCPELEECKRSMKITRKIELRITQGITAPLLAGIFRPVLLIPDIKMRSESLMHVLQHELTHYKRKDLLYKWFALLVNAVHWFNPLVYLVIKNISEDCEISCDCAVTQAMECKSKREYMKTILSLLSISATRTRRLTNAMASDKKMIIRRFEMIQKVRKPRKIITMLSAMLAAILLMTSVFTSSALAEVGKDGLEYWTKNEVYNKNGIQFNVMLKDKALPDWVKQITGKDGNLEITISNLQVREVNGWVVNFEVIKLKGKQEINLLSSGGFGYDYGPNENLYKNRKLNEVPISVTACFDEYNGLCMTDSANTALKSLVSPDTGEARYVGVTFALTEDKSKILFASIDFGNRTDSGNFEKYTFIETNKFRFVGDSQIAFLREFDLWYDIFTDNEKYYKNKKIEGINCAIASASNESIELKAKISLPRINYYSVEVYDENGTAVGWTSDELKNNYPVIILKPDTFERERQSKFNSGKTYRVDIGLQDDKYNVVYRQREYVKIP